MNALGSLNWDQWPMPRFNKEDPFAGDYRRLPPDESHLVWRRVGGHEISKQP
jgi:hypothetical protein